VPLQAKGSSLEFRVGLSPFQPGWRLLAPISSGRIEVLQRTGGVVVRYRLGFHRMCAIAGALTAWVFYGVEVRGDQEATWAHLYRYALLWLWLVGGNYLIARWRWRGLVASVDGQVS